MQLLQPFAFQHVGLAHLSYKGLSLSLARFKLPVVLVHRVIPFLKFRVGQELWVRFFYDAASFVHRVNDGRIYSRIGGGLQQALPHLVNGLVAEKLVNGDAWLEKQSIIRFRFTAELISR